MKKLTKKAAEMTTKELAAYIDYSVLKDVYKRQEERVPMLRTTE